MWPARPRRSRRVPQGPAKRRPVEYAGHRMTRVTDDEPERAADRRVRRKPGPKQACPSATPISSRTGPLTITAWAAPASVAEVPCALASGQKRARWPPRPGSRWEQRAITAFAATLSAVTTMLRVGTAPRISSGARPSVPASHGRVQGRRDDRQAVGEAALEIVLDRLGVGVVAVPGGRAASSAGCRQHQPSADSADDPVGDLGRLDPSSSAPTCRAGSRC